MPGLGRSTPTSLWGTLWQVLGYGHLIEDVTKPHWGVLQFLSFPFDSDHPPCNTKLRHFSLKSLLEACVVCFEWLQQLEGNNHWQQVARRVRNVKCLKGEIIQYSKKSFYPKCPWHYLRKTRSDSGPYQGFIR